MHKNISGYFVFNKTLSRVIILNEFVINELIKAKYIEMELEIEPQMNHKKAWIAGLLSFLLPGLGHFYLGQVRKAIAIYGFLLIYVILICMLPIALTFMGLVILLALATVYYIVVLINAIGEARRIKEIEKKKYDIWYVYVLIFIAIQIAFEFIFVPLKFKYAKIQSAIVPTTSMTPELNVQDYLMWEQSNLIHRNEVAIFKYPDDEKNTIYVSRCIAVAGDKLEIKNGGVYINNSFSDNPEHLMYSYKIEAAPNFNIKIFEELNIKEITLEANNLYRGNLTLEQAETLKNNKDIKSISKNLATEGEFVEYIFPFDQQLAWNTDYYGPLIIPKKGQKLSINEKNAVLYGSIIKMCEGVSNVRINEQGLLEINGAITKSYQFKKDYYFMMGDNRHNAADSRFKGLIPQEQIKGKALYIWWSDNKNRIGKSIQ